MEAVGRRRLQPNESLTRERELARQTETLVEPMRLARGFAASETHGNYMQEPECSTHVHRE